MIIIGKDTLAGTASGYDTGASSSLMYMDNASPLPAHQVLTSMHFGYGDVGGTGTATIKLALYDTTDGTNNAPKVEGTVSTFTVDMDALSGNSWLSLTGLDIDLSAYSGRELSILLSRPDIDGLGVLSEFSASDVRHRDTPKLTEPPTVFQSSSTSAYIFPMYAVLETSPTLFTSNNVNYNNTALDFFITETGTSTRDFNTAAITYYKSVTTTNSSQFNELQRAAQKAVGFVGLWPGDIGN